MIEEHLKDLIIQENSCSIVQVNLQYAAADACNHFHKLNATLASAGGHFLPSTAYS